ncbi:MAG: hypothetical protein KC503_22955, partial [Myxococcales bacterium]|nr:hypothetical protein [Myxococcales bacterium]
MLARLFAHALAPLAALVPLAVLVLSCGCSGDDVTPISGECPEATFSALPAAHHKLDVLIVADTSARMAARWAAWDAGAQPLASALLDALRDARFGVDPDATTACSALDRRGCALPDLRVGVVSADLGAPGVAGCDAQGQGAALRAPGPGCATLADDWLAVSAAQSNVQDAPGSSGSTRDDIEIAAGCLLGRAALGSAPGCAVAQPLEAARRAVSAQNGFLRDDAALLLLVLSASDDCSSDDAARLFDAATTGLGAATPHRCL